MPRKDPDERKEYNRLYREKMKCEHNKQKPQCRECKGLGFCELGKNKSYCHDCKGSGLCEHDKRKSYCRICNGSSFCV